MRQNLPPIKALLTDVDGVLTNGTIWYNDRGEEWKGFSARDGLICKALAGAKLPLGWITGRDSAIVTRRAREVHVPFVRQGVQDKAAAVRDFCKTFDIEPTQVAYIGDDWNDLPAMNLAGFIACPQNAATGIQQVVDWIIPVNGGQGVLRAFVERWQGTGFGKHLFV